jgi:nitric oxide reductase subunit B
VVFIAGGALPALWIAYLGIRYTVTRVTLDEPEDILFTEVREPDGIATMGDAEAAAARLV